MQGPLSSYEEDGKKNHVSTTSPYLNGIVTCSETTKSDSKFKNSDYIFDFTYGVEHRNSPPHKRRKSNSADSDLKWGVSEPQSSANIDSMSKKIGSSHEVHLLESREHNYFSTTNQSTSASKMWTSSSDMNIKDSDTEYWRLSSLPVFEQSGDPNEIDDQLNF